MQLLAYHTAVLKGTDVDQPRNLAKSVMVELGARYPPGCTGSPIRESSRDQKMKVRRLSSFSIGIGPKIGVPVTQYLIQNYFAESYVLCPTNSVSP